MKLIGVCVIRRGDVVLSNIIYVGWKINKESTAHDRRMDTELFHHMEDSVLLILKYYN